MTKEELLSLLRVCGAEPSAIDAVELAYEEGRKCEQQATYGVDWGKAGQIPCVTIIKRLPNGGIEVMAVEYAPYSDPQPKREPPKFPTMLRKMWSGGEVQDWINENWNKT